MVRRLAAAAPAGIAVTDEHTTYGVIAVQGPRCEEVLAAVGLPTELDYMHFADATWDGRPVVVCRTGYTGERGYELLPLWDDAERAVGRAAGGGRAARVGCPAGWARATRCAPRWATRCTGMTSPSSITPVMARVAWAVGWGKERFWGREPLLAERAAARAGVGRLSWGLVCTGRGIPRAECAVRGPSRRWSRSASRPPGTFSPTLKQGIALALLDRSVAEGDELVVDVRGRDLPVRVVKPPFVEVQTKA